MTTLHPTILFGQDYSGATGSPYGRGGILRALDNQGNEVAGFPKGNLEPGKTAQEIALQEAWEEAGLAGLIQQEPIGSYFYDKDGLTCHVMRARPLLSF